MLQKLMRVIGLALVAETINAVADPVKLHNPRFTNGKYHKNAHWDLKPEYAIDGLKGSDAGKQFAHSHLSKSKGDIFAVDLKDSVKLNDLSHVIVYPRADCCWNRYETFEVLVSGPHFKNKSVKLTPVEAKMDTTYVKAHINDGLRWDLTEEDKLAHSDILDAKVFLIMVKNSDAVQQIAEIEAFSIPEDNSVLAELHNPRFTNNKFHSKNGGQWDLKPEYAIDGIKGSNIGDKFAHSHLSKSKGDIFAVDFKTSVKLNDLSHVIVYPRADCCWFRYETYEVLVSSPYFKGKSVKLTPVETKMDSTYVKAHINDGLRFDLTEEDKLANADILNAKVFIIMVKNSDAVQQIAEIEAYYVPEEEDSNHIEVASSGQVELFRPRFEHGRHYKNRNLDLKPEYAIDGIKGSETTKGYKFAHSHASKYQGDTFIVGVKSSHQLKELSHVVIYPRADCCWNRYQTFKVFVSIKGKSVELTPEVYKTDHDYVKTRVEDGLRWNFTDEDKSENSDILDQRLIMIMVKNSDAVQQIAEIEAFYER